MRDDLDHCREQAERARRWADWLFDVIDRERLQAAARDYELMAQTAVNEAAIQNY